MKMGRPREHALEALSQTPLDLLIIGGGIVGSGVARDAAMRGLKVGLVEQHDFAFGTSSRSSRLLHGGLRYLAQGRVGLVHEASVEKKIIHHIAPHLAEPLPFIFPTYRGNKNWVLWQLKIGVKIYDLLCSGRNLGKSTWLSCDEVREKVPALTQTNLNGAVRYYDGFTNDARLTLDTLRSAAKSGANIVNYCRFKNANWSADLPIGSFQ
jgi:glycerol-3-phosphate dehydrogenase